MRMEAFRGFRVLVSVMEDLGELKRAKTGVNTMGLGPTEKQ